MSGSWRGDRFAGVSRRSSSACACAASSEPPARAFCASTLTRAFSSAARKATGKARSRSFPTRAVPAGPFQT